LIIINLFNLPFGWGIRPEWDVLIAIYYIGLAAGVLALIGLMTNLSLLIFAACAVYLQAYTYSFGDFHHPEAVMMIALAILALSPSGRVLSLDSLFRRRKDLQATNLLKARGEFAGWPIRLLQWFFVLMYLSAVVAKLSESGVDWANGFTLQYYLIRDGLRWGSPLAVWLGQHHTLIHIAQYGVLLFQATFALAVVFPKLRWFYVPAGLALHTGILLTLKAPFYEWMCLYVIFVPWTQALHILSGYRQERSHAPVAAQ
jgi:hypothetical protein